MRQHPKHPSTAPISAGRTGSADRPRPGSSAKRVPISTGTGAGPRPPRRRSGVEGAATAAASAADRGHGRPGQHQQRCGGPADAQDQPVRADPRVRLKQGGHPDGVHGDATIAPAIPTVAPPPRRGTVRRRPPRSPAALMPVPGGLEVERGGEVSARPTGRPVRTRRQRRQPEGEKEGGRVPVTVRAGSPKVARVPIHHYPTPGYPGEIGAEPGDRRGAALEPYQCVDEAVVLDSPMEVGP